MSIQWWSVTFEKSNELSRHWITPEVKREVVCQLHLECPQATFVLSEFDDFRSLRACRFDTIDPLPARGIDEFAERKYAKTRRPQ